MFFSLSAKISLFSQIPFISPKTTEAECIEYRFPPPDGFMRIPVDTNSIAHWLRNLPLLPDSSPVTDYRGREFKSANDTSVAAVINMNIKGQNLLQCMDIIIRLQTEYLWRKGYKEKISGILPDGLPYSWRQWSEGYRAYFTEANYYLKKTAKADASPRSFSKYLNQIFELSGTQAFYHYFPDINPHDIQIGDFIVKKGYHGHAVMIVDLARDSMGNLMALIGQGDTPACQFYLLRYNNESAWFPLDLAGDYPSLPIKKKMYWSGLRRFPAN